MNCKTWNRRIVLAAASATLIGGGVALPAAAMAAPSAPQHGVTLTPRNDGDHPGLQDGDHSVPGVMGGDLMDPDYPPSGGNDDQDPPGSSADDEMDPDDYVELKSRLTGHRTVDPDGEFGLDGNLDDLDDYLSGHRSSDPDGDFD